jgi:hypothetical protein
VTGALRVASLAVLGTLLLHNLASTIRNQRTLPCGERLCSRPRDLEQLATVSPPKVSGVAAIFHHLGRRIGGGTLTVPPWMEKYRWELEHIARVRVEVSNETLLIDPIHLDALRAAAGSRRAFLRRGGSEARWLFQDLHVQTEDGVDEYVLAQEGATWGALFIVPRARYEEVRAR